MEKIAVVTDTGSNLSFEQAKELGIYLLPLQITIDETTYQDTLEISITWTFISNSRAILCMVEAFVDNPFVNGIANTVSYSFFSSSNKS